ncbi:hypothetical protein CKJ85_04260 [Corynebacterium sp. NML 150383]|nr:hypothetical protein CKJ85_04260 [Corynebacterium sp. NML 150383]
MRLHHVAHVVIFYKRLLGAFKTDGFAAEHCGRIEDAKNVVFTRMVVVDHACEMLTLLIALRIWTF